MSSPSMEVFTSDPFAKSNGIDATIHELYAECLRAVTADTTANLCFYMLHDQSRPTEPSGVSNPGELVELMSEAAERAKLFQLLIEVSFFENEEASNRLFKKLDDSDVIRTYPYAKEFGKRNKGVKIHDKNLLFDTLNFDDSPKLPLSMRGKTLHHVVVISSANIWYTQYSQSNQAIVYWGNQEFYDYYLKQWEQREKDMEKEPFTVAKYQPNTFTAGSVTAYALPRAGVIIEEVLDNVLANIGSERVRIRLAMSDFSHTGVAKKLAKLAQKHDKVDVKVVLRKTEGNQKVAKILRAADIDVLVLERPASSGGTQKVHSKFLLIDAPYELAGVVQRRRLAWAGALNYTGPGLTTNGETLVRMEDGDVFDELLKAWNRLRYQKGLPRIDAAFSYGTELIYFFAGGSYVKYIPRSEGTRTIAGSRSERVLAFEGWKNLQDEDEPTPGIDAAIRDSAGTMYFFRGDKYTDWIPGTGVVGWQFISESSNWGTMPYTTDIDAAYVDQRSGYQNDVYFFKGAEYWQWKLDQRVQVTTPESISSGPWNLPVDFHSGIDAVLAHGEDGRCYFFKGSQYCSWHPGDTDVPTVASIAEHWSGVMLD